MMCASECDFILLEFNKWLTFIYMSWRYNQPTGRRKRKEQTKKFLVNILVYAGVTPQQQQNYTKMELPDFACTNGIDLV
jgi:hypothetical protein